MVNRDGVNNFFVANYRLEVSYKLVENLEKPLEHNYNLKSIMFYFVIELVTLCLSNSRIDLRFCYSVCNNSNTS